MYAPGHRFFSSMPAFPTDKDTVADHEDRSVDHRRIPGDAMMDEQTGGIDAYLAALASAAPTPGGGSAAALVGAFAAALVAMIARITGSNPAYAAHHDTAAELVRDADRLRAALIAARSEDEVAYGRVVTATALPKNTAAEKEARRTAVQGALAGAAAAPVAAAALTLDVLRLAKRVHALGNAHLVSDVACAFAFARASLEAGAANVRINLDYLADPIVRDELARALARIEADAATITFAQPGAKP